MGGIKDDDDWYPHPHAEVTADILKRSLALCPEIVPPASRANGKIASVDDLQSIIIEPGCGFRPGRKGGIRLESEWRTRPGSQSTAKVLIVHNYG